MKTTFEQLNPRLKIKAWFSFKERGKPIYDETKIELLGLAPLALHYPSSVGPPWLQNSFKVLVKNPKEGAQCIEKKVSIGSLVG